MSEFVTILSDSTSHGLNLHNQPHSFRCTFSDPIVLNGISKIGLWEISLSNAISSQNDLSSCLQVWAWTTPKYRIEQKTKTLLGYGQIINITDSRMPLPKPEKNIENANKWYRLTASDLSSPENFVGALNTIIYNAYDPLKLAKKPLFSYSKSMRKIWFNWPPSEAPYLSLVIKGGFLRLIGAVENTPHISIDQISLGRSKIGPSFLYKGKTLRFAPDFQQDISSDCSYRNFMEYEPHIRPHISDLLVYCSAATDTRIGDSRVSVIKWIEFKDHLPVSRQTFNFASSMQYFGTKIEELQVIDIEIRDKFGNYVPLQDYVRVVLHILRP